jgi:hypothetical protein
VAITKNTRTGHSEKKLKTILQDLSSDKNAEKPPLAGVNPKNGKNR